MDRFVDVAPLQAIAPGNAVVVRFYTNAVALFNVHGRIFAVGDACVRCGSSLAAGSFDGELVQCPGCTWKYDVATGGVNGMPSLRIDTFQVRVIDSHVHVANLVLDDPGGG